MNWKVREVPAGEFKAKCLQLMEQVDKERIELVITKRGKPVAKLVPVDQAKYQSTFGCMKGTATVKEGVDIVSSDPSDWSTEGDDESWW